MTRKDEILRLRLRIRLGGFDRASSAVILSTAKDLI